MLVDGCVSSLPTCGACTPDIAGRRLSVLLGQLSGVVFPAHRPSRRISQRREGMDCMAPRAHSHGGTSAGAARVAQNSSKLSAKANSHAASLMKLLCLISVASSAHAALALGRYFEG